jgi:hypothetical protein
MERIESKSGLGPVGDRVAANVKALRTDRSMSLTDLSRKLTDLGRPVQAAAIRRIENAVEPVDSEKERKPRRVDVDDLVALAVALDTSPNRLLLEGAGTGRALEITPKVTASEDSAWRWARGEQPLDFTNADHADRERKRRFRSENLPTMAAEATFAEVAPHFAEFAAIGRSVAELVRKSGVGLSAVGELVNSMAAQILMAPEGDVSTLKVEITGKGAGDEQA